MSKDLSGNTLKKGDDVFLIKSFINTHYAQNKSYSFEPDEDDDEDYTDKELEKARARGYIDTAPLLDIENDEAFLNSIQGPKDRQKRLYDVVPEEDINISDFKKDDKVKLPPNKSIGLPVGKIIYVEPSKVDRSNQLKNSINIILNASKLNEPQVELNDYLTNGIITSDNYNTELLKRNEILTKINTQYTRPDQRGSYVYVQVIDSNNRNHEVKYVLNNLKRFVEQKLTENNPNILVYNLSIPFLKHKAEEYRSIVPSNITNLSSDDLLQLFSNTVLKNIIDIDLSQENIKIKFYNVISNILKELQQKTNITKFNEELFNKITNSLVKKNSEYKKILKDFNYEDFLQKLNEKSITNKKFTPLSLDKKDQYIKTIDKLLQYLSYTDGLSKYSITDIVKIATVMDSNKLAIEIENWFICNEGKILKSIFG